MLINLRNALMTGKRTPTARDYVQSGLVAMWDGIENAGWGTHNASATTWKDLIGSADITLVRAVVNSDHIYFPKGTSTSDIGYGTANFPYPYGTMEAGFSLDNDQGYCIIAIGATVYAGWGLCSFARSGLGRVISDTYDAGAGPYASYTIQEACTISITKDSGPSSEDIFKNGVKQSLGTVPAGSRYSAGTNSINASTNQTRSNDIRMRFIRIYSRVLTDAEIAANYAIDKARFGLP